MTTGPDEWVCRHYKRSHFETDMQVLEHLGVCYPLDYESFSGNGNTEPIVEEAGRMIIEPLGIPIVQASDCYDADPISEEENETLMQFFLLSWKLPTIEEHLKASERDSTGNLRWLRKDGTR